uniref:Uncharacterized protein n=1 Tax=Odontella aurita TaxID=265563 RepID=A0A7S4J3E9_9STRA
MASSSEALSSPPCASLTLGGSTPSSSSPLSSAVFSPQLPSVPLGWGSWGAPPFGGVTLTPLLLRVRCPARALLLGLDRSGVCPPQLPLWWGLWCLSRLWRHLRDDRILFFWSHAECCAGSWLASSMAPLGLEVMVATTTTRLGAARA